MAHTAPSSDEDRLTGALTSRQAEEPRRGLHCSPDTARSLWGPAGVTTASDRDHELREELVLAPSPRSTSPLHHTTAAGYDGNGNGHGLGAHDKDLYMANGDRCVDAAVDTCGRGM